MPQIIISPEGDASFLQSRPLRGLEIPGTRKAITRLTIIDHDDDSTLWKIRYYEPEKTAACCTRYWKADLIRALGLGGDYSFFLMASGDVGFLGYEDAVRFEVAVWEALTSRGLPLVCCAEALTEICAHD